MNWIFSSIVREIVPFPAYLFSFAELRRNTQDVFARPTPPGILGGVLESRGAFLPHQIYTHVRERDIITHNGGRAEEKIWDSKNVVRLDPPKKSCIGFVENVQVV